jgi:hypothetical protein
MKIYLVWVCQNYGKFENHEFQRAMSENRQTTIYMMPVVNGIVLTFYVESHVKGVMSFKL